MSKGDGVNDEEASRVYQSWLEERWKRYDMQLDENHRLSFTRIEGEYGGHGHILVEKAGASIMHRKADGTLCDAHISFDLPEVRIAFPERTAYWKVDSWEPLTLRPSLHCLRCGDHGFVTSSGWVKA